MFRGLAHDKVIMLCRVPAVRHMAKMMSTTGDRTPPSVSTALPLVSHPPPTGPTLPSVLLHPMRRALLRSADRRPLPLPCPARQQLARVRITGVSDPRGGGGE